MGRGRGNDREWADVVYRKNQRRDRKSEEVTFYVGNLPDGTTHTLLWMAFQPFGVVSDAYVARKRDASGNWFGFIRLVDVVDLERTLAGMNTVSIYNAKLVVSLAKYVKGHHKFKSPVVTRQNQDWRPKPNHAQPVPNISVGVQAGKTYSDALTNSRNQPQPGVRKRLVLDGNGSSYFQHCLGRSVIGVARDLKKLGKTKSMLDAGGFREEALTYVGGLRVMITFHDKERAREFVENFSKLWMEVWSEAKVWYGENFPFDRIVGLRITGVPLQLREDALYDKVGSMFGKVVWPSDSNWEGTDVSAGNCHVLTNQGLRIDEEISLAWNGGEFRVWVTETVRNWAPSFFSVESSAMSPVKEANSEPLQDDEVEEGEIRGSTETEVNVAGDLENERSRTGGIETSLHGNPGDASHGEMGNVNDGGCDSPQMGPVPQECSTPIHPVGFGPRDPGPSNFKNQDQGNTLGKRNRAQRSPPSVGSTQGPPVKPFFPNNSTPVDGIDLNHNPVSSQSILRGVERDSPGDVDGEVSDKESDGSSNAADTLASVPDTAPPIQVSNHPVSNEEIDLTVRVGSLVGIELGDFQDQVRAGVLDSRKTSWIRGLKSSYGVHFLAIQETKLGDNSNFSLSSFWGRSSFAAAQVFSEGRSGGLVSLWDPTVVQQDGVLKHRSFLLVSGTVVSTGVRVNIVNVYAPNDPVNRRTLWAELIQVKETFPGMWILMGDFNDVRSPEERKNSEFVPLNAWHFNSFIQVADLHEFHMGGHKFTYVSDSGLKFSKLDRVLVCSGFRDLWPTSSVTALSRYVSDHSPVLLTTTPTDYGHIPFRFFNSWLEIPGFRDHVAGLCCSFSFIGPSDLALATKLKFLKNRIKAWVSAERARTNGEYLEIKNNLERIERAAEVRDLTDVETHSRTEGRRFILEYDRTKLLDIQQKARVKWALEGDENSSFFHGIINANTANNKINGIVVDGEWVNTPTVVKEKAFEFFANKFVEPMSARPNISCSNLAQLSDQEAGSLVQEFTLEEIKTAIWDCDGDRAPGPDGFNFKFLKHFWPELHGDFLAFFNEFYNSAAFSPGCASSFLALIPKVNDPTSFSDFRPISLVGCINKVVSKVLVNRLKRVVGKLISAEQSAFLAGRSITDGPLMLNEMVGWMKRAKSKGLFFKVDIDKAYDSLNWGFLESVMHQMNFPYRWRKWIMAVVSSARASVLVNGSPTQEFTCYRGLRQGDPISPFLFVIAMEALTGVMKRACSVGLFHGIRCTNSGPILSHLIYADDVVFLGEWSRANVLNLRRIMWCFYLASGLKVNMAKCSLFGIGVGDGDLADMAELLGCKIGSFPFKFLGLQVGANMNLYRHWKPVLDTVQSRLSIWKAKTLSFGGRVTLIKSVLNSLPIYYFSLYRAPENVIDTLDRMRRVFFWGGSDEKAKANWVAWQKVIAPTSYGGMGFGSLRDTNSALLAKWWWRFKGEDSGLWRRVVWALHHNSRSWNFIPAKMTISGPWKQIYKSANDLLSADVDLSRLIKGVVRDGKGVMFWTDCWCGDVSLATRYPNLFRLENNKFCKVAERVKVDASGEHWSWDWKRRLTNGVETVEFQQLEAELGQPSLSSDPDKWVWTLDGLGSFSVGSLKRALVESRYVSPSRVSRWNSWVPKKVGIVVWRAELDRLPTRSALIQRHVNVPSILCPTCGEVPETVEHVFVSCGFAQSVWSVISQWCKLQPIFAFSIKDLLDTDIYTSGSGKYKKALHAVVLTTIWSIWKHRNARVFDQAPCSIQAVIGEVKTVSHLWVKHRSKQLDLDWEVWKGFNLYKVGW
ncbi:putative RNA-directed DNA polymerase [Helianthus annuus]|uniref:RNA-directed DNA polymerase n=1 Tax=Helianthus annuus TaxID=4232 RepID=A0A9K3N972_HELAN|nr:putative RNA-directed DNA polymerase [Helianthus annuus]